MIDLSTARQNTFSTYEKVLGQRPEAGSALNRRCTNVSGGITCKWADMPDTTSCCHAAKWFVIPNKTTIPHHMLPEVTFSGFFIDSTFTMIQISFVWQRGEESTSDM